MHSHSTKTIKTIKNQYLNKIFQSIKFYKTLTTENNDNG
ncbi:hypothetical protein A0R60_2685 [Enterobacter asburiae]|nr:hypothetical protein A0R60_2685 [Enterobacter asburiae]